MDVHRCRFVPYPPSAINSLAFSHPSPAKLTKESHRDLRLAVGRANGCIEIWNPSGGNWFQETTFGGGRDRTIDAVVWINDRKERLVNEKLGDQETLRLFSIGQSASITEWDLVRGIPLQQCSANHGEIWCIAVQPSLSRKSGADASQTAQESNEGQDLAVGCADGVIALISTVDGSLQYRRHLAMPGSRRARVLSLAFQDRHTLVAGYADGKIRIFNTRNGQQIRSMSLSVGAKTKSNQLLVWAVKCLPDRTIVSGDSTGEVRFWDGKTYTLIQRIQSHQADVLTLELSQDGNTVISGGMDRRTIFFRKTAPGADEKARRWTELFHRRYHTHDVKAMATYDSRDLSVVVSGGPDTFPILIPLRGIEIEVHRRLPNLPQKTHLHSAPHASLVVSWWDQEIRIWKLASPTDEEGQESFLEEDSNHKLVAKLLIKGDETITSISLSSDGLLLLVSTVAELKLFALRSSADGSTLQPRKIILPHSLTSTGAKMVVVSSDSHWLALLSLQNEITIVRIVHDGETYRVLPSLTRLKRVRRPFLGKTSALEAYKRNISHLSFSQDCNVLICGDLSGYIDSWLLQGIEDSLQAEEDVMDKQASSSSGSELSSDFDGDAERASGKQTTYFDQRWISNPYASMLPQLPSPPLVLAVRPTIQKPKYLTNGNHTADSSTPPSSLSQSNHLPSGEVHLIAVTSRHEIVEYSVSEGTLTPWSRRNPKTTFPKDVLDLQDRAKGCVWDIRSDMERLWVYGYNWLWMIDLSQDFSSSTLNVKLLNGTSAADYSTESKNGEVTKQLTNGTSAKESSPPSPFRPAYKKRKRTANSGAGDLMRGSEMRLIVSDDVEMKDIQTSDNLSPLEDVDRSRHSDDSDVDDDRRDLVNYRRSMHQSIDQKGNEHQDASESHRRGWWLTLQYRPILGIVPLSVPREESLEVALVERPIWDTDLPTRFHNGQEWS